MCVCARDATCSKRECCQRSLSTAAVAVAAVSPASSSCRVCFLPIANHKIQIHSTLGGTRSTRYFGYYSEYSVLTTPDARTLSLVRSLSLSLSCALSLSRSLSCRIHISRGFARSSPNSCASVCISLWVVSRLVRFWVRPDLKKYYKKRKNTI